MIFITRTPESFTNGLSFPPSPADSTFEFSVSKFPDNQTRTTRRSSSYSTLYFSQRKYAKQLIKKAIYRILPSLESVGWSFFKGKTINHCPLSFGELTKPDLEPPNWKTGRFHQFSLMVPKNGIGSLEGRTTVFFKFELSVTAFGLESVSNHKESDMSTMHYAVLSIAQSSVPSRKSSRRTQGTRRLLKKAPKGYPLTACGGVEPVQHCGRNSD